MSAQSVLHPSSASGNDKCERKESRGSGNQNPGPVPGGLVQAGGLEKKNLTPLQTGLKTCFWQFWQLKFTTQLFKTLYIPIENEKEILLHWNSAKIVSMRVDHSWGWQVRKYHNPLQQTTIFIEFSWQYTVIHIQIVFVQSGKHEEMGNCIDYVIFPYIDMCLIT